MSNAWLSVLLTVAGLAVPALAVAQAVNQSSPFQLPPVTVTAQKEPADSRTLPVSVTAVSGDALTNSSVSTIRKNRCFCSR